MTCNPLLRSCYPDHSLHSRLKRALYSQSLLLVDSRVTRMRGLAMKFGILEVMQFGRKSARPK